VSEKCTHCRQELGPAAKHAMISEQCARRDREIARLRGLSDSLEDLAVDNSRTIRRLRAERDNLRAALSEIEVPR
jgi:hypothetical protein